MILTLTTISSNYLQRYQNVSLRADLTDLMPWYVNIMEAE